MFSSRPSEGWKLRGEMDNRNLSGKASKMEVGRLYKLICHCNGGAG